MPSKVRCFVAYPSEPASRAESVELAIKQIADGGVVEIAGWKDTSVGGRIVISAICEQIHECQLFIADVTGLNPNVLFELGYAIALDKRVWLLFDPNMEKALQEFNNFQLLTTVGYSRFSNSHEIIDQFYKQEPYNSIGKTLLLDLLGPVDARRPQKSQLLHLKPNVDTEAAIRIARRVAAGPIPSVIDDPKEERTLALSWYVQRVHSAFAVTCQFLSTDYKTWQLQNAKQALVAGLAHGLGKPLLMLAQEPYLAPIDYRDMLRRHHTASEADAIYGDWLLPLIEAYEDRREGAKQYELEQQARGELRNIAIGDAIAEFESEEIPDYFVPTAAYNEALRSKHSIFVGRKGTGKTASLYKLAEELRADPRNHICIVKPVDYELEGLVGMLDQQFAVGEKGYLIEGFWKFLLFTELAKSVNEELLRKPEYYERTEAELRLAEFVEEHQSVILPEFSVRLEAAVRSLGALPAENTPEANRSAINSRLHSEMLARLRLLLGGALRDKEKVAILVDNLDKSWNQNTNLQLLSELLFGLLSVSSRVALDFGREKRGAVNLSLTLFLRSDIYAAMIKFARERDKLPVRRISWNDPELLRSVVEERFMKSGADVTHPALIWERYFPDAVRNIPVRSYLASSVLKRPRDLIFLVKAALETAVNRGHVRIQEKDLSDAQLQYSNFALNSVLTEATPRIPEINDLLVEFAGSSEIVNEDQIKVAMRKAGIDEIRIGEIVEILTELTFLGPETAAGRFEFINDEDGLVKTRVMARNLSERSGNPIRYRINPPFHAFLEVSSDRTIAEGQLQIELSGPTN